MEYDFTIATIKEIKRLNYEIWAKSPDGENSEEHNTINNLLVSLESLHQIRKGESVLDSI